LNYRILVAVIVAITLLSALWGLADFFGPRLLNIPGFNDSSVKGSLNKNVDLLIDFGNGTRLWFNNTKVPGTDNFYNVTYQDVNGNLQAVWDGYPLNAHLVYRIMGYGCNGTSANCDGYWSLWRWNGTKDCWSYSEVGADLVRVSDSTMAAWYFTTSNQPSFPGKCA
jgi:hypothetical protein